MNSRGFRGMIRDDKSHVAIVQSRLNFHIVHLRRRNSTVWRSSSIPQLRNAIPTYSFSTVHTTTSGPFHHPIRIHRPHVEDCWLGWPRRSLWRIHCARVHVHCVGESIDKTLYIYGVAESEGTIHHLFTCMYLCACVRMYVPRAISQRSLADTGVSTCTHSSSSSSAHGLCDFNLR